MPLHDVQKYLLQLSDMLPPDGSLGYASDNMKPHRKYVDATVNHIVSRSEETRRAYMKFKGAVEHQDEEVRRIFNNNEAKVKRHSLKEIYLESMRTRLGNIVIKAAIEARKNVMQIEAGKTNYRKPVRKGYHTDLMTSLMIGAQLQKEINRGFYEFLADLDKMEYKRVQEEGGAGTYFDYEM